MIGIFANAMLVATRQNMRSLDRPAPRIRRDGTPKNTENRDD